MKRLSRFIAELFRRKVVRLLGAYIAIFWLLAEGYASFYQAFGLPGWSLRVLVIVGIALIPVLALISWKYDITPPQLVRDSEDLSNTNPALKWAQPRHDGHNAGFVLLKWQTDDGAIKEKRFFTPVSIGRGLNNNIDLADERVSRYHAVLWAEEGSWRVRDMDSSNGTFLNNTRVDESATLPQTCELRLHPNGPVVFIHIDRPAETVVA